jgi:hypothetical protein
MSSWDEDELWDDRDEPIRSARLPTDDEPAPPIHPVPLEPELEGSVYRISDKLWWFRVWNRDDHPGLCVRCECTGQIAVMCLGRDVASPWALAGTAVEVAPGARNGLTKPTAFALAPWPVSLRLLRLIHTEGGWLGRLEADVFDRIREHIDWLERVYPEARQ